MPDYVQQQKKPSNKLQKCRATNNLMASHAQKDTKGFYDEL